MTDIGSPETTRTSHCPSHYTRAQRIFLRLVQDGLAHVDDLAPADRPCRARDLLAGTLEPWQVLGLPEMNEARRPLTYFIEMGVPSKRRPIKIGTSVDPAGRLAGISTHSPYPLTLLATYSGSLLPERELHDIFRRYRMRMEWFRPGPTLVALIDLIRVATGSPR